MASGTIPATFSELYTDLSNRVKLQTGITATQDQAKRYIDIANHEIYIGASEKLPWAKRQATITTHPEYRTGTVAVTVGSTTVTGTSTLWTTTNSYGQANARAGGKIVFAGRHEVYRVTAVGGAGSLTISPAFIGTTDSETTYRYFEDEYAVATDFLRPYFTKDLDGSGEVPLIGDRDFEMRFPRNSNTSSRILAATMVDFAVSGNTTPIRKLRIGPPSRDAALIPYTYITSYIATSSAGAEKVSLTADADEPIIPRRYRVVLVLHALYNWYRDQKDDGRSQEAKLEFEQKRAEMVGDQEIGQQRTSVAPRAGYVGRARRPYRRGAGTYWDTTGEFFRRER